MLLLSQSLNHIRPAMGIPFMGPDPSKRLPHRPFDADGEFAVDGRNFVHCPTDYLRNSGLRPGAGGSVAVPNRSVPPRSFESSFNRAIVCSTGSAAITGFAFSAMSVSSSSRGRATCQLDEKQLIAVVRAIRVTPDGIISASL